MSTVTRKARIEPLAPPYEPEIENTLRRMMPPDVEPLKLFRTVAKNPAILDRFRSTGAYILNFGRVDPLEREIVIHRTTARCGCEYEWGVHAAYFPALLGLSPEQVEATVTRRRGRRGLVAAPGAARTARGRAARQLNGVGRALGRAR